MGQKINQYHIEECYVCHRDISLYVCVEYAQYLGICSVYGERGIIVYESSHSLVKSKTIYFFAKHASFRSKIKDWLA